MDLLSQKAIYSYDAINNGITISGPGWSNLFTGVGEGKHKVIDNSFKDHNLGSHPDFLTVIKENLPEYHTAAFYTWLPVGLILDKTDLNVSRKYAHNGDAYVHKAAIDYLSHEKADATVVYYGDVDIAGHTYGFYEEVPQYYEEIVQFDRYVGDLLDAINSRKSREEEEWLIVLSTDHGGYKTGHGGTTLQERNIFVMAAGDNIFSKEIKPTKPAVLKQEDQLPLSDLEKYGYDKVPTQLDVAATILDFLEINTDKYQLDGSSLLK
ncbi:hypothetical protein GCM10028791_24750 [Echinicola sediminis]